MKVLAAGEFVEEGSAYSFPVGASAALLRVVPGRRPRDMRTVLEVDGKEVPQSELLGGDGDGSCGIAGGGVPVTVTMAQPRSPTAAAAMTASAGTASPQRLPAAAVGAAHGSPSRA